MIFKSRTRPRDEQGGDWGSFITANLATLFPESLVGLHLNLPPVSRSHCEQSAARHQHQDMLYSQCHSVISCLFINFIFLFAMTTRETYAVSSSYPYPRHNYMIIVLIKQMLSDGGSLRQFVASIPGLGRLLVDEEDLHLV